MAEGLMLKAEEQMELAVLGKHGTSIRELARMTGRSRNTVRRYLRGGRHSGDAQGAAEAGREARPFQALHRRAARGCGAGSDSGSGSVL
jgi:IS30 family transposase